MKNIIILIFLLISSFCFAKISDNVSLDQKKLTSEEKKIFKKFGNGETNDLSVYYDAFAVISTDKSKFSYYRKELEKIRNKSKKELLSYREKENDYKFADRLLKWLYDENILVEYVSNATLAEDIIERGNYNCLSSAVLYGLLALDFELDVKSVLTTSHAYCIVKANGKNIKVETTVRRGFDYKDNSIVREEETFLMLPSEREEANKKIKDPIIDEVANLISINYLNAYSLDRGKSFIEDINYRKAYYIHPNEYNKNLLIGLLYRDINYYDINFTDIDEIIKIDPLDSRINYTLELYCQKLSPNLNTRSSKYDFKNAVYVYREGLKRVNNTRKNRLEDRLVWIYALWIRINIINEKYDDAIAITDYAVKDCGENRGFNKLRAIAIDRKKYPNYHYDNHKDFLGITFEKETPELKRARARLGIGLSMMVLGGVLAASPFVLQVLENRELHVLDFNINDKKTQLDRILLFSGAGMFTVGIITYLVFFNKEQKIKNDLTYAFYPTINQNEIGILDYGYAFNINYRF